MSGALFAALLRQPATSQRRRFTETAAAGPLFSAGQLVTSLLLLLRRPLKIPFFIKTKRCRLRRDEELGADRVGGGGVDLYHAPEQDVEVSGIQAQSAAMARPETGIYNNISAGSGELTGRRGFVHNRSALHVSASGCFQHCAACRLVALVRHGDAVDRVIDVALCNGAIVVAGHRAAARVAPERYRNAVDRERGGTGADDLAAVVGGVAQPDERFSGALPRSGFFGSSRCSRWCRVAKRCAHDLLPSSIRTRGGVDVCSARFASAGSSGVSY